MPAAAVRDDGMVVVSFRHTGSAPVLRQQKFKVRADQRFAVVGDLLRQQLGLAPAESLFLYCNSAFAPPPDELVRDVAQCFAVEGVLVLNYCTTPAWG
jgi:ubiquitin-like protein ATG12